MLLCIAILDNTIYRIYDTEANSIRDIEDSELKYRLRNNVQVENLRLHLGKIKGKGIDIIRLGYSSTDRAFIIAYIKNESNKTIGYRLVYQSGQVTNKSYNDTVYMVTWGYVINATLVDSNIRLIDSSYIQSIVVNEKAMSADTNKNTTLDEMINIMEYNGFKLGYFKNYSKGEMELRVYTKLNCVVYFNMRTDSSKINTPGGYLLYQDDSRNIQMFDLEHKIKDKINLGNRYGAFTCNKDNIKKLAICTLDKRKLENKLRDKYFNSVGNIGKNYWIYLFIISEYKNYSDELKKIYSQVYDEAVPRLLSVIKSDIKETSKDKMYAYIAELLDYYDIDWEDFSLDIVKSYVNGGSKDNKPKEHKGKHKNKVEAQSTAGEQLLKDLQKPGPLQVEKAIWNMFKRN